MVWLRHLPDSARHDVAGQSAVKLLPADFCHAGQCQGLCRLDTGQHPQWPVLSWRDLCGAPGVCSGGDRDPEDLRGARSGAPCAADRAAFSTAPAGHDPAPDGACHPGNWFDRCHGAGAGQGQPPAVRPGQRHCGAGAQRRFGGGCDLPAAARHHGPVPAVDHHQRSD